jgi:hypothetical protein
MAGSAMDGTDDQVAMVRRVIAENVYMVLGTADESGRPGVAPVFYAADGERDLYWMSSPDVTHSRNLARRPELSIVVFDSQAPVGTGGSKAVYMAGSAAVVPDDDVARALEVYPGPPERGARRIDPAEVGPSGHYRLYRATITDHFVLCPGGGGGIPCPEHALTGDHRAHVTLP